MKNIQLEVSDIPHGHGLSFKKGVSDGLLGCRDHEEGLHETHAASYQRGIEMGDALRRKIASLVKS